ILLILIGITNLMLYLFLGRELEELVGFCLVIFMVFLAAITDFIQEYKSFKINNALHEMVQNTYVRVPLKSNETVTKENIFDILKNKIDIMEDDITVGDILYLSKGDVIPTDCKII